MARKILFILVGFLLLASLIWLFSKGSFEKKEDPFSKQISVAYAKEREGKFVDALYAFQEAIQLFPDEVKAYSEMGDFYLRNGQKFLAYEVWKSALLLPNAEDLWIKMLFWTKVLGPDFKTVVHDILPPPSNKRPLIEYLLSIAPEEFWNEERLPNQEMFLQVQEGYWLRLLEALRIGNRKEAESYIVFSPFRENSIRSDLELAVLIALRAQKNGTLVLQEPLKSEMASLIDKKSAPIFKDFLTVARGNAAFSKETKSLIASSEIFSYLFSEAGWANAAILLNKEPILPEELSSVVAVSLIDSYRQAQGPVQALQFASLQKPSPELLLLIKEINASLGKFEEASPEFEKKEIASP